MQHYAGNRNLIWHIFSCNISVYLCTVIPDTLQVSYSRSLTGQPVPEGASLTLTCSASIQSEQLTHLSIIFGKRGGGEGSLSGAAGEVSTVREIISIDRLLGVVPGRFYKSRYDDGEITLEKKNGEGGQGVYMMKMKAVQPDDTGSYFCEASQWILDPDRSWQKIAQRTLDIGNLTVQQLGQCDSETVPAVVLPFAKAMIDSMWQLSRSQWTHWTTVYCSNSVNCKAGNIGNKALQCLIY